MRNHRSVTLWLCLASTAFAACTTTGSVKTTPPGLHSIDEARKGLVISVVVPSLQRTMGALDALAARTGIPMRGDKLLAKVLGSFGLGIDDLQHLNIARPIAYVMVASAPKESPRPVVALTAHSNATADALVAAHQPGAPTPDGMTRVRGTDGTNLWVMRVGATLLLAHAAADIPAYGALALAAQETATGDDATIFADPVAIARWRGARDVADLLQHAPEMISDAGGGKLSIAERATVDGFAAALSKVFTATDMASVGLSITAATGVQASVRLTPRPGTPLAQQLATPAPYAFDSSIAGPEAAILAGSFGSADAFWELHQAMFAALAKAGSKEAKAAGSGLQTLASKLSGKMSLRCIAPRGALICDTAMQLRPGVTDNDVLDAGLQFQQSLGASLSATYGKFAPTTRATRTGDALRIELTYPVTDGTRNNPGVALTRILGSNVVTYVATVKVGSLRVAMEPGAADRLAAQTSQAQARLPTELAPVVAATSGYGGFMYLELMGLARAFLGLANLPRDQAMLAQMLLHSPLLGNLKLPITLGVRSGKDLSIEFTLPTDTLTAAGTFSKGIGAMGLGGSKGITVPGL